MGRIYSIVATTTAWSLASNLVEMIPADDKPCILHALFLSNIGGTADAGDANEQLLHVGLVYATVSNTGGVTTTVISKHRNVTQAAGVTARVFSTITTTGVTAHVDAWNVRVPYQYYPTPEMRDVFTQADVVLQFRLLTAATNAHTVAVTAVLEEV